MVPSQRADLPDVVLVVVDCARSVHPSRARPTGPDLVAEIPAKFVQYERAVAAATWSLPSHASLFTGLYPWNHGCHNLGGLHLASHHATVARRLKAAGYATAAFSSNSVLAPETGLLSGFDVAAWGRWSENIFRFDSTEPPHQRDLRSSGSAAPAVGPRMISAAVASTLRHFPAVGQSVSRLARHVRSSGSPSTPVVSPWIEPAIDRWLASVPRDQPIFSVVNLMDLHEPYLPERSDFARTAGSFRFSLVPQDGRTYALGQGHPPSEWIAEVQGLYSDAYRTASQRIAHLWAALARAGRAERLLFVVTSDHGQSFGEGGWFFHSHGQPRDELTRVPLAVHFPDDSLYRAAYVRRQDWVSLVDVAPTIADVVGTGPWKPTDGSSLLDGTFADLGGLVLSAGDGPIQRPADRGRDRGPARAAPTASCAAYVGDAKLLAYCRGPGEVEVLRTLVDPEDAAPISGTVSDRRLGVATGRARSALLSMLSSPHEERYPDVSRRLTAWGYG